MLPIDIKTIEKRKKTLEKCKKHLKKEFIGIDAIIDNLLDYIQVWYLMPEILTRPVIVNLWGMTGVGKTDLIRKTVKFLNFQDRFAEIELSNTDQSYYRSTVYEVLNEYDMNDGKPNIILFDEIQRFNTLNENGAPIPQTKFMDFWELLSDGQLSRKERYDLEIHLLNILNKRQQNKIKKAKGEEIDEEGNGLDTWEAREFHKSLGGQYEIEYLLALDDNELFELILKSKKEKKIYEPINHSKTLIIISGNLDEAFQMATQTSEADVDADIFHAFTKKITMVDIKNALSHKFRPEQVARFGNIHLIYNSLKKSDFEKLIAREVKRLVKGTKTRLNIELSVDNSIHQLIYRNGVFPVQGVRPVFSSVIDILETNLSKYLFEAIIEKNKKIHISYHQKEKYILAKIGTKEIKTPFVGRIDKIRQANVIDTVANISVHESGHAIAYMLLIKLVPLQLKSKVASSYAGGFTFPHQIHDTKINLINKIKIFLAGGVAEEIIFGEENASIGRSNDREKVTMLVIDYIRRYGFDNEFQSVYTMDDYPYTLNKNHTDIDIEKMTSRLLSETRELLVQHVDLLKELSIELAIKGAMKTQEIANVAKKFGIDVAIKEEGYLHIANYDDKMKGN